MHSKSFGRNLRAFIARVIKEFHFIIKLEWINFNLQRLKGLAMDSSISFVYSFIHYGLVYYFRI